MFRVLCFCMFEEIPSPRVTEGLLLGGRRTESELEHAMVCRYVGVWSSMEILVRKGGWA